MNYYCDESCHLLNIDSDYMAIGVLYCSKSDAKLISNEILNIKLKHSLNKNFEIKSTKISNGNLSLYLDLINYFLNNDKLKFRSIIINKRNLNHKKYNQTHEDWYYKMYFLLINKIDNYDNYNTIYMDYIGDSSGRKCSKLSEILYNSNHHNKMYNVIPINSKSSNILQLADLLIGLTCYSFKGLTSSPAKLTLIDKIKKHVGITLQDTNYSEKFNILDWRPNNV